MDDIDDTEEANEEDLIELGDEFAQVKVLVNHIQDMLNDFTNQESSDNQNSSDGSKYIYYCAK